MLTDVPAGKWPSITESTDYSKLYRKLVIKNFAYVVLSLTELKFSLLVPVM